MRVLTKNKVCSHLGPSHPNTSFAAKGGNAPVPMQRLEYIRSNNSPNMKMYFCSERQEGTLDHTRVEMYLWPSKGGMHQHKVGMHLLPCTGGNTK